jgi:hypothetical protein
MLVALPIRLAPEADILEPMTNVDDPDMVESTNRRPLTFKLDPTSAVPFAAILQPNEPRPITLTLPPTWHCCATERMEDSTAELEIDDRPNIAKELLRIETERPNARSPLTDILLANTAFSKTD